MERYEFSEGSSNKFWEIKLEDCSVITTYGRIGSDGKTTVKEFDDDEKAQKEYDKLVKSKVKKGYVAVANAAAKATKKKVAKKKPTKKAAKKSTAKKTPKKKAAKKPNGDYTRYEFSEGSSNKFWEIKLEDCSVYTRYGRIGSDGKVTVKEFDDDEKAQKEYDKLVKSKTKKGYIAV